MTHYRLRCMVPTLSLLLLFAFMGTGEAGNTASSGGGIVFLTLTVTADTVRLTDWKSVPGRLKKPRAQSETAGLLYEAAGTAGKVLWQGSVPNPLVQRFDYEDPDHPGALKAKIVTRDSAIVVIRLPADLAARHVSFWKLQAAPSAEGAKKSTRRVDLGAVSWPPGGAQ